MNIEQSERRLQQFERRMLADAVQVGHPDAPTLVRNAVDLAAHAALPVVCDADFLHLLRINFFVDNDALPYWVEGRMLLSPLWNDLGDGLYAMEPALRRLLLQRLVANRGARRTTEVATLLWRTAERRGGWVDRTELRHAQQLTALNFLAPARAREWLAQARQEDGGEEIGNAWFVAMGGELELPKASERAGDARAMCELLLSLTPAEEASSDLRARSRGQVIIIHGEPGSAPRWRLLQDLAHRSPAPRLLWLEVDPASEGKRLFARLPGRRDRAAVHPENAAELLAIGETDRTVVAIDHAENLKDVLFEPWLHVFRDVEVYLLFHRRILFPESR
jgi:hypothetical protein